MQWVQAVLYTALVCKSGMSARRLRRSDLVPHLTSGMFVKELDAAVDLVGTLDMSDFIKCDFCTLPEVSDVSVKHHGDEFHVEISVTDFDRKIRNKIYAKQKALYREFPTYSFDFSVIDSSPEEQSLNVHTAGSSPQGC